MLDVIPEGMLGRLSQAHPQDECRRDSDAEMNVWSYKLDKIRNDHICEKVQVAHIKDKMIEGRLRWYSHVLHRL